MEAINVSDLEDAIKQLKTFIVIFAIPSQTTLESPHDFLEEIDPNIYLLAYIMIGSPLNPRNLLLDQTFIPIDPTIEVDLANTRTTVMDVNLTKDQIREIIDSSKVQVYIEQNTQKFYVPLEIITQSGSIKLPVDPSKHAVFNNLGSKNWLSEPQPSYKTINAWVMPGLLEGPPPEVSASLIETQKSIRYYIGLN